MRGSAHSRLPLSSQPRKSAATASPQPFARSAGAAFRRVGSGCDRRNAVGHGFEARRQHDAGRGLA